MSNFLDKYSRVVGIFLVLAILAGGGGIIYKNSKSEIRNSKSERISNDQNLKSKVEKPEPRKINLNTASEKEIESLPAIGKTKAKAIIEYREKYGKFKKKKDIIKVKGIEEKVYEKIKDLIEI